MKLTSLPGICSRLLRGCFLAALAMAAVTLQNGWIAPIAQQAYLKASNTGGHSWSTSLGELTAVQ